MKNIYILNTVIILVMINFVFTQDCADGFTYFAPVNIPSNVNVLEGGCPNLGDLNSDGGWNVLDIVTLANCVLAENCTDLENGCAGDLNGDGGYNVLDIVTLANCVLAENCDRSNCFANSDIDILNDLISLNTLDYSSPLEVGVQTWLGNQLYIWVATYTQNGVNGVNQQLTQLPDDIGQLDNLKQLYLEWNNLTSLPSSFSQLSNLENLAISNNWLTALPNDFGNLSELSFLDLGYNQIAEIPESIGNLLNIEYLWLFHNQLSSVPESICDLPLTWNGTDSNNYPYFAIGGNQICDLEATPECVATSGNLNISLDQFYYSFLIEAPQDCID